MSIQAIQLVPVTQPKQEVRTEARPKKVDPIEEVLAFIPNAKSLQEWGWIGQRLIDLRFKANKMVFDAFKHCPDADVKRILIETMSDMFLNTTLTAENIGGREQGFMRLIQAASFVGRSELLRQINLVRAAYRDPRVNRPLPVAVKEKIAECERIHRERSGSYTKENLEYAGYTLHRSGNLNVWVHPDTKDSLTVSNTIPKNRLGARHDRRDEVGAAKVVFFNRAGELMEVRKHTPIKPLTPEERELREKADEAERKRKADAAAAQKKKEAEVKAGKKGGKGSENKK